MIFLTACKLGHWRKYANCIKDNVAIGNGLLDCWSGLPNCPATEGTSKIGISTVV
jgi:hypothetical protein